MVKNPPANEGDTGSSPGPGRSHIKKKKKFPKGGMRVTVGIHFSDKSSQKGRL